MKLNSYQRDVMSDLSDYIESVNKFNDLHKAWKNYWNDKGVAVGFGGVPAYQNVIDCVPHVCMKVPTGGGKTFMACAAVRRIFDGMPSIKTKMVVWLVPSDSILAQTTKNLRDVNHSYRQRINADFSGRVQVFTKDELLSGQNFSPDTVRENLTICILSYGSLRIDSKKKDVRKVYQKNGNLLRFAEYFKDDSALLADTPDTALIQVIRHLSPVVIVDESHNAGSDLSIEMLNNLNPSFVLDLTATPRQKSNIISYVEACRLKKENMVKLPVIVYNRNNSNAVIDDAIQLRCVLEGKAKEQEKYIRPIVLFQAQPKTSDDSETFDKIKKALLSRGIPENQIGIKTSKIDDISRFDLMSRECEIRYIITVNALKEGWDCPFAYILATVANKTSKVDVEQILGRILRQPYAKNYSCSLLNTSYVLTCSNNFRSTLDNVVAGLNSAGFTKKDYRIGENEITEIPQQEPVQQEIPDIQGENMLDEIILEEPKTEYKTSVETPTVSVSEMVKQAEQQNFTYEEDSQNSDSMGFIGGELGNMLKQYRICAEFAEDAKSIKIPQFFIQSAEDLFGGTTEFLDKSALLDGFSLSRQDAKINFSLSTGEIYEVDIAGAVPKYKKISERENEVLRQQFARLADDEKKERCISMIIHEINRDNAFSANEISNYVHRIVGNMTEDEVAALETSYLSYAKRIKDKIAELKDTHREKMFYKWLDSGVITCQPEYVFPEIITPSTATDSVPKSLYEAEFDDMNNFERRVLDEIAGCENVVWWHRIIERKGFRINAFINHYPDFVVKLKSGKILLIEVKGDDRDNSDSRKKLELGKKWASESGKGYNYFMVFENIDLDGVYRLEDFADIIKNMK